MLSIEQHSKDKDRRWDSDFMKYLNPSDTSIPSTTPPSFSQPPPPTTTADNAQHKYPDLQMMEKYFQTQEGILVQLQLIQQHMKSLEAQITQLSAKSLPSSKTTASVGTNTHPFSIEMPQPNAIQTQQPNAKAFVDTDNEEPEYYSEISSIQGNVDSNVFDTTDPNISKQFNKSFTASTPPSHIPTHPSPLQNNASAPNHALPATRSPTPHHYSTSPTPNHNSKQVPRPTKISSPIPATNHTPNHPPSHTPVHTQATTPAHTPGHTPSTPSHTPNYTPTHTPGYTPNSTTHTPNYAPVYSPSYTPNHPHTHNPTSPTNQQPPLTPNHTPGHTPSPTTKHLQANSPSYTNPYSHNRPSSTHSPLHTQQIPPQSTNNLPLATQAATFNPKHNYTYTQHQTIITMHNIPMSFNEDDADDMDKTLIGERDVSMTISSLSSSATSFHRSPPASHGQPAFSPSHETSSLEISNSTQKTSPNTSSQQPSPYNPSIKTYTKQDTKTSPTSAYPTTKHPSQSTTPSKPLNFDSFSDSHIMFSPSSVLDDKSDDDEEFSINTTKVDETADTTHEYSFATQKFLKAHGLL